MTPLPRLTEIGDSAKLTVKSCIPVEIEGEPMVEFTFVGFEDEPPMLRKRLGVDGAFLRLNFAFKADRAGEDPVIDYAGVVGETLLFSRTKPTRGVIPAWRIDKVMPLPPVPAAPVPVKTIDVDAVPGKRDAKPYPPRLVDATTMHSEHAAGVVPPGVNEQMKRETIHAAFERELTYVLGAPLALVKKKKAEKNFDINGAVALLLIEQAKRGCL